MNVKNFILCVLTASLMYICLVNKVHLSIVTIYTYYNFTFGSLNTHTERIISYVVIGHSPSKQGCLSEQMNLAHT